MEEPYQRRVQRSTRPPLVPNARTANCPAVCATRPLKRALPPSFDTALSLRSHITHGSPYQAAPGQQG
jgi:hypothetical protein